MEESGKSIYLAYDVGSSDVFGLSHSWESIRAMVFKYAEEQMFDPRENIWVYRVPLDREFHLHDEQNRSLICDLTQPEPLSEPPPEPPTICRPKLKLTLRKTRRVMLQELLTSSQDANLELTPLINRYIDRHHLQDSSSAYHLLLDEPLAKIVDLETGARISVPDFYARIRESRTASAPSK